MGKEEFKQSIYRVVEFLTKQAISPTAEKLIANYFNDSNEYSTYLKAMHAIHKYYADDIPPAGERPPKLVKLLEKLEFEAHAWDNE